MIWAAIAGIVAAFVVGYYLGFRDCTDVWEHGVVFTPESVEDLLTEEDYAVMADDDDENFDGTLMDGLEDE